VRFAFGFSRFARIVISRARRNLTVDFSAFPAFWIARVGAMMYDYRKIPVFYRRVLPPHGAMHVSVSGGY